LIAFFNEDIQFQIDSQDTITFWIQSVISQESCIAGDINYIFTSDEYLVSINRQYLDHDYYTDIITFDQSTDPLTISGDIYISIDRVRANAIKYRQPFKRELKRVLVHGILHLIGYGDQTPEEKSEMRKKEEAYLSL
jgi:rRNA maturation RNase YbeY